MSCCHIIDGTTNCNHFQIAARPPVPQRSQYLSSPHAFMCPNYVAPSCHPLFVVIVQQINLCHQETNKIKVIMMCHLTTPSLDLNDGVHTVVLHPLDAAKNGGIIKRVKIYNMSQLQKRKKKLNRHRGWKQKTSATYRNAVFQIGDHSLPSQQVSALVTQSSTYGTQRAQRGS